MTGKLKCTILNFHEGERCYASLDDDNMVKPIRDAMNGLIYNDDSQISYSGDDPRLHRRPDQDPQGFGRTLSGYNKGDVFFTSGSTTRPISSNSQVTPWNTSALKKSHSNTERMGIDRR